MREKQEGAADAEREGIQSAVLEDMRAATKSGCMKEFSRKRATCMLDAPDLDSMASCPPTVDRRAKEDRPSPDACKQLGLHLDEIFRESMRRAGADAGEEDAEHDAEMREVTQKMVSNSVRECGWTMSKAYVSCQMKATTLDEIVACAPSRIKTPHVDEVIDQKLLKPAEELLESADEL